MAHGRGILKDRFLDDSRTDSWAFSEQDFEGIELLDSMIISDFGFGFWKLGFGKNGSRSFELAGNLW
ncbi:unnamed protein product [Rhizophagus irregularis]|nr:unnamed protein product [Rhizophagus irregularis]